MAKRKSITISASQEAPNTDAPMVSMTKAQFNDLRDIIDAIAELAAAKSDNSFSYTLDLISSRGQDLFDEIEAESVN